MKKVFLGILIVLTAFLSSSFKPGGKEHDKRLVGIWKGFQIEKDQEGVERHWILHRYENGKYVIMFTFKEGCDVETTFENGTWWTKDGVFYEKNKNNNLTDVYNYEVKDDIMVNYTSIEMGGVKKTDYTFTDYKLDLD